MKNRTELPSDATLLALGLLDEDESARVSLYTQESVQGELQFAATEDMIAALLLHQSAPPRALPELALKNIQSRIAASERRLKIKTHAFQALRWSGWAAAAALAFMLYRAPTVPPTTTPVASNTTAEGKPSAAVGNKERGLLTALRQENETLKAQLSRVVSKAAEKEATAPAKRDTVSVIAFNADGSSAPLQTMLPKGSSVAQLLAESLKPWLVQASGAAVVGPELMISSGFGAFTSAALPEGFYYRHLSFPANEAASLGLSLADDGSYYDPTGQIIWSPDPDQLGTYVGMPVSEEDDLTQYQPLAPEAGKQQSAPIATSPAAGKALPAENLAKSLPPVIAVVDPVTNTGEIIVPEPPALEVPAGYVPVILSITKNESGEPYIQSVQPARNLPAQSRPYALARSPISFPMNTASSGKSFLHSYNQVVPLEPTSGVALEPPSIQPPTIALAFVSYNSPMLGASLPIFIQGSVNATANTLQALSPSSSADNSATVLSGSFRLNGITYNAGNTVDLSALNNASNR